VFRFQLILQVQFALVQPAELVDLVLVLAAHFDLVGPRCRLVFLGELGVIVS
jgi:hypothetical protein